MFTTLISKIIFFVDVISKVWCCSADGIIGSHFYINCHKACHQLIINKPSMLYVIQSVFYCWTKCCINGWHHKSLYSNIVCSVASSWAVKSVQGLWWDIDESFRYSWRLQCLLRTHRINSLWELQVGYLAGGPEQNISTVHASCMDCSISYTASCIDSETAVMWYGEGCQPTCSTFHMNL